MNEIKQTLQQDADALLKRLQQSRKNGTGVTLGVSDVGVLCEVLGGGGWISVDFMLPKIEQEVLILYKNNVIQGGRYNIREDSGEYSHEWEWWCELLDSWGLDQNNVTHWMPLPKEPSHD